MSSKRRRQRLHSPHECRPDHRSYQYQSGDQAAPGATSSGAADYAHLPITWHRHYIVAEAQELHPPSSRDDNLMRSEFSSMVYVVKAPTATAPFSSRM